MFYHYCKFQDACSTCEQIDLLHSVIQMLINIDYLNKPEYLESWFKLLETTCRAVCLGEQDSLVVSYCRLATCLIRKCIYDEAFLEKFTKSSLLNDLIKEFTSNNLYKCDESVELLSEVLKLNLQTISDIIGNDL